MPVAGSCMRPYARIALRTCVRYVTELQREKKEETRTRFSLRRAICHATMESKRAHFRAIHANSNSRLRGQIKSSVCSLNNSCFRYNIARPAEKLRDHMDFYHCRGENILIEKKR